MRRLGDTIDRQQVLTIMSRLEQGQLRPGIHGARDTEHTRGLQVPAAIVLERGLHVLSDLEWRNPKSRLTDLQVFRECMPALAKGARGIVLACLVKAHFRAGLPQPGPPLP